MAKTSNNKKSTSTKKKTTVTKKVAKKPVKKTTKKQTKKVVKNNSKELVLTVLAVIALIALVSGATYAYFNVNTTNNFSSSTINTEVGTMGTVALNGSGATLILDLSAVDMMKGNAGTYFASSNGTTRTATEELIGTAIVDPVDDTNVYHCEYTLNISHAPMVNGEDDLYTVFNSSYANKSREQVFLSINGVDYDWNDGWPSTVTGSFDVTGGQNATIKAGLRLVNSTGINQNALGGHDIVVSITVPNNGFSCNIIDDMNVVPENAVYLRADTGTIYYSSLDSQTITILNAVLSQHIQQGLTYDMLNYGGTTIPSDIQENDSYMQGDYAYQYHSASSGWTVVTIDKSKTSYEPILRKINNVPITNLDSTFWNCQNLVTSPTIPNTVTSMRLAYENCYDLENAPTIPNSVIDMRGAFYDCTSLVNPPTIGINVTNMEQAFDGCTSLVSAPVIPSSVTNMFQAFYRCTSLTGSPVVNANPSQYTYAFYNTQITGISGSTSLSSELYATKTN